MWCRTNFQQNFVDTARSPHSSRSGGGEIMQKLCRYTLDFIFPPTRTISVNLIETNGALYTDDPKTSDLSYKWRAVISIWACPNVYSFLF